MSYQLVLDVSSSTDQCKGRSRFNEAIEFAMRTSSSSSSDAPWIPLQLTYQPHKNGSDGGPSDGIATIRGYNINVTAHLSDNDEENIKVTESVHICGDLLHDVQEVQFRWMGTVKDVNLRKRMWALANVTANLVIESENTQIFQDTFGSDTLK